MKPKRIAAIEIQSSRAGAVQAAFAANFGLAGQTGTSLQLGGTSIGFRTASPGRGTRAQISGLTVEVEDLEAVAARLGSFGWPIVEGKESDGKRFIQVDAALAHGVDLKIREG